MRVRKTPLGLQTCERLTQASALQQAAISLTQNPQILGDYFYLAGRPTCITPESWVSRRMTA